MRADLPHQYHRSRFRHGFKVVLQLKHLISPEGMEETFQVFVMSRDVPREKAAHLSGLTLSH